MDRRHHRGVDQAAVGEREEVEAVVDDVELVGALEARRRCAGTRRPWGRSTSSSDHPLGDVACSGGGGDRVGGGEQRHVVAARRRGPRSAARRTAPTARSGAAACARRSARGRRSAGAMAGLASLDRGEGGRVPRPDRVVPVEWPHILLEESPRLGWTAVTALSPFAGSTSRLSRTRSSSCTSASSRLARRRAAPRPLVRDPVDVPADGVRHRHVLGGAAAGLVGTWSGGGRRALRRRLRTRGRAGGAPRRRIAGTHRGRHRGAQRAPTSSSSSTSTASTTASTASRSSTCWRARRADHRRRPHRAERADADTSVPCSSRCAALRRGGRRHDRDRARPAGRRTSTSTPTR